MCERLCLCFLHYNLFLLIAKPLSPEQLYFTGTAHSTIGTTSAAGFYPGVWVCVLLCVSLTVLGVEKFNIAVLFQCPFTVTPLFPNTMALTGLSYNNPPNPRNLLRGQYVHKYFFVKS